jgi:hypothetical protein
MSLTRVGSSYAAVDYDCAEAEERHFHMSHPRKAEKRTKGFKVWQCSDPKRDGYCEPASWV